MTHSIVGTLRLVLAFLLLLLAASPVRAQLGLGTLVSYRVDVYDISLDPNGTGKPLLTMTLPLGAALCNLAPLAPPKTLTQVNPQAVYWNDAVNVGKICKLSTPLLGTLPNLPGANYIVTVTSIDDVGRPGPNSNTSLPFNNTGPVGLTGVVAR